MTLLTHPQMLLWSSFMLELFPFCITALGKVCNYSWTTCKLTKLHAFLRVFGILSTTFWVVPLWWRKGRHVHGCYLKNPAKHQNNLRREERYVFRSEGKNAILFSLYIKLFSPSVFLHCNLVTGRCWLHSSRCVLKEKRTVEDTNYPKRFSFYNWNRIDNLVILR